ncbi:MAG TPA: 4Fe-4S dicluster domain-containing protein [Acidimicrobiia bacterium]|nr:4Fe-4S dicluster domain-containing protein [Acidimicrobiia bacterium]
MTDRTPPLTPYPLRVLLGRVAHEWETRHRIFDLPIARIFDVSEGPDLGAEFMGRPAATPIGPAAGPHTQMAQNIVLAWLGGARIMELKTVQVLDELEISRPCIDMETVGYNVEWSQELKIRQSLEEYVKAWMMIEILRGWPELEPHLGADPGPHIFDISVGYDLAGISSPEIAGFIEGLEDATEVIDRLRVEIPEPFTAWRGHTFPTRVADTVTLSTFHGCPPGEIESITKHLMTRHGLDVVVKLNPTLLGFEGVGQIVHELLGYEEVGLRKEDFDADLQFDRGVELIDGLARFAAAEGRRFGVKLSNTLVVDNHRDRLPDTPMYLSGQPLHVVTTTLLGKLDQALPGLLGVSGREGPVQVSFSAGLTKDNLASVAALGLTPMTVCSDLLKPGGYGRIKPMLEGLQRTMEKAGCPDLAAWRRQAGPEAVAGYVEGLRRPEQVEHYSRAGTSKMPRSVDSVLERWGCVACNFCVTVCPNDAFVRLPTPEGMEVEGRQQYFCLAELCNECGNCTTFCPEIGEPWLVKPRLFLDAGRFAAEPASRPGFLIEAFGDRISVTPKPGYEADVVPLTDILNAEEGLPIRPADLVTASTVG